MPGAMPDTQRRAVTRTPGAGGTPSAKRHRKQRTQPPEAVRERPHKRGREGPAPPPLPPKRACMQLQDTTRHGGAGTEVT